tara:strand:- start:223 stop:435 length:213 start_codon:yes stop_codon:yes gene_type:complete
LSSKEKAKKNVVLFILNILSIYIYIKNNKIVAHECKKINQKTTRHTGKERINTLQNKKRRRPAEKSIRCI